MCIDQGIKNIYFLIPMGWIFCVDAWWPRSAKTKWDGSADMFRGMVLIP